MISISRWLAAPFVRLRRMTFGTRWVEPWNEVTVAVYASLNPATATADLSTQASAEQGRSDAFIPADSAPAAVSTSASQAKSADRTREAA